MRKGATLVVADPRKIWLTKLAKRHLQLRPGSDVWLLNAMMHTILEEGLQNEEYIRETTDDFEAVREIVMRYSPEDAEQITGGCQTSPLLYCPGSSNTRGQMATFLVKTFDLQ